MKRNIHFLGLGFELGQEQQGLSESHEYIRSFFPELEEIGLKLLDHGAVEAKAKECVKLYSTKALERIDWRPYRKAYSKIQKLLRKPGTVLNWGGDHSVALSTVGAFTSMHPDGYVVWIDAHADLNPPMYSPSGNLHGMPVSVLLNLRNLRTDHFSWIQQTLSPQKLIYVGVRDLDPYERRAIEGLRIQFYSAQDVRSRGMQAISEEIYRTVKGHPLHVSFDIDSLDPVSAPATGVPVAFGLSISEIDILAKTLSKHSSLRSMDVVEINPELGTRREVMKTYSAAFHFLTVLLNQGGIYDDTRGSDKTHNSASLEPGASI